MCRDQKIKKTAARLSLELDPTPDILAELGRKKGDRLLVGFAAETENLAQEARRKLESKNCDMVVANLVGRRESGFESDENEVVLVLRTGETIPVDARPSAKSRTASSTRCYKLRLEASTASRMKPDESAPVAGVLPGSGVKELYRQASRGGDSARTTEDP